MFKVFNNASVTFPLWNLPDFAIDAVHNAAVRSLDSCLLALVSFLPLRVASKCSSGLTTSFLKVALFILFTVS